MLPAILTFSVGANAAPPTCKYDSITKTLTISGDGEVTRADVCDACTYTEVEAVVIEPGITCIGDTAFFYCSNLKSVTIPSTVDSIKQDAFLGCSSLSSVTIPEGVVSIGMSAFGECYSLTSVTIPESVVSIGMATFFECTSLKGVNIPSSFTSIPTYFFYGCSSLTDISIPSGVASIGEDAFKNSGLKTVYYAGTESALKAMYSFPDSVTVYSGQYKNNGILYAIDNDANTASVSSADNSITSADILSTIGNVKVTSIGQAAFNGYKSLTSVSIPEGVTNIGGGAFNDCSGLASIVLPSTVTDIGQSAFSGCTGLTSIRIPANVTSIGWRAFMGCSGLTSVTFEEGSRLTTLLGNLAFMGCQALRYFDASACTNMTTTTVNRNSVMSAASALLYLPEGYTSSGANVIIGSTCDSLALTDGNTVEIPKAFTASKVTYNRTFTPDVTATVCLPFTVAVANVTGGDFYELGNVSDDYVVTMNKVTGNLEANTPYIFKPSATALAVSGSANVNAVSSSTNATATDGNWAFCGTYEKVSWATDDDFGGATIYGYAANDYGDKVKAGDFVKVKAGNSYINPCRAYLKYTGGTAAKGFKTQAALPDRLTVRLVDSDGTTTDIDSVKGEEGTVKNPTRYNLAGQRVDSGYKGIVIMNRKKTYIK